VCEPAALDDEVERAAHLGHRWWYVGDGLTTDERLYPPSLPELLRLAKDPANVIH
jgi:hypothetical protein